jgi:hypothetical protein
MNEQDKEAFENWFKDFSFKQYPFTEEEWEVFKEDSLSLLRSRDGWQAALEYERERSNKLVELLEDIHFKLPNYVSHKKIADVLKEYRGEK